MIGVVFICVKFHTYKNKKKVGLIFLVFGELLYSRFLSDYIFGLSDDEVTPANEPGHEQDPDYCATPAHILWGHHWTSITGAAPIVGPAMAAYYGWLPALLWIVFGCLLSGAVHDFSTLVVSARSGGRSIADIAGHLFSPRMRIIFLLLINFLCVLVVAKFMEVIAKLFILWPETVLPVWMEVPLAIGLGFVNRRVKDNAKYGWMVIWGISLAVLVILYGIVFAAVKIEDNHGGWELGKLVDPVFGFSIGEGKQICRDSVNWNRKTDEYTCGFGAMQFWTLVLCVYAMVASCLPVWVLLQPRDFINSHQLKVVMAALILAIVIKAPKLDADAVRDAGEYSDAIEERNPIFPMMFTLIACGATSGFHGLVSSGVTSKQLNRMRDARAIGYSGMMGESMLSTLVVVVVCSAGTWKAVYATGMNWTGFLSAGGTFLEEFGFDPRPARTIMNVLVVSFAATTLDSGMRIQRILVGELGGQLPGAVGNLFKNTIFQVVVSAVPSIYIANSRSIGAVWDLFGATNQLTACVSLIVCATYLLRFRKYQLKYVIPLLVPIAWLLFMITWALVRVIVFYVKDCTDEGKHCDWYSTKPVVPTIILAFLIALLVFAVYVEVGLSLATGKLKQGAPLEENGKLVGDSLKGTVIGNIGCC